MSETTQQIILWLIPAAPLAAAVLIALFGKLFLGERSHLPCAAALGVAFVCSLILLTKIVPPTFSHGGQEAHTEFFQNGDQDAPAMSGEVPPAGHSGRVVGAGFQWIKVGSVDVRVDLRADAMTAIMLAMVTGVSFLVSVFASGYMHHDPGYPRFFAAVSLFVFSMCMLVLAGSYLMLFVFWEAVGLCSYLLIGFWFKKPSAAAAAKKAFVVNRIGDFGLILGVFLIWTTFGSLNFDDVFDPTAIAAANKDGVLTTICLLLFVGAMGKSAQFPLHVWLPDAMEGPTPVSALIHAATMVTAGVYLVARSTPLFVAAPDAQLVVAGVGAATALIAALTALTQTDLKRVMAYSTVSQLGFMFMGLGAAAAGPQYATFAVTAAMFHLFTHAYFKALLFLASGSVMHAMGDIIDMRRFSGLKHALPITHWTFACGAAALAGVPLLSGFWSKDEILAALWTGASHGEHQLFFKVIFGIAVCTALLTAFYTFRAYFMTFWGKERWPEEAGHHPHEAGPAMAWPLRILAVCAVGIGAVLGPIALFGGFPHYLHNSPSLPAAGEHGHNVPLMIGSGLIALAGIALAYRYYVQQPQTPERIAKSLSPLYHLSLGKFYFDEIFLGLLVLPIRGIAFLCEVFDKHIVDKLVDAVGTIPKFLSQAPHRHHNGLVQNYAMIMWTGVIVLVVFVIQAAI